MKYLNILFEEIKEKKLDIDLEKLELAYFLASESHIGQLRHSGDNYILHPVEVTRILINMRMDTTSLIAGLLHDLVEDTFITLADLEYNFGKEVANIVDGVTKLKKLPNGTKQQDESIRKMMLATSKDLRVIIIKLADRLHNMRTLEFVSEEKQKRISKETLDIYAPLAHRLGMAKIKGELEDLCFMYLYPDKYVEIKSFLQSEKEERDKYIDTVVETVDKFLNESNIKGSIKGRFKHYYSIYKKIYEKHRSYEDLYDLMGIRIIVKDIITCYHTLGIIHEKFNPIPGRFKDYIAVPKSNNYQSIHTTIVGPEGKFVEIQIRTEEMDKIAEEGIAAHWSYKENIKVTKQDKIYSWLRDIVEFNNEADNAKDFVSYVTEDIIEKTIFVFSPLGDILELKYGSTPIDFAFAIHSQVGCKCIGAKVDGDIVPLNYKLKNGDRVEIITSKNAKGPGNDWLDMVATQGAKNKIRKWLKEKKWEENIKNGKENLEKDLSRLKIPMTLKELEASPVIQKHMEKHNIPSMDDFYFVMGEKKSKAEVIIEKLKDYQEETIIKEQDININNVIQQVQPKKSRKKNDYGIIIDGIENTLIKFAKCCTPLPGDDISGYITKVTGITIHRKDCVNFKHMIQNEPEREIEVKWDNDIFEKKSNKYLFKFVIFADEGKSIIMEVINLIASHKIVLTDINSTNVSKNNKKFVKIKVAVEIYNKKDYSLLLDNIKKIKQVISIER